MAEKVEFLARTPSFDLDGETINSHWNRGEPLCSAVVNGLSTFLPLCERYFIKFLKDSAELIPDEEVELHHKIEWFCTQEANHARMHEQMNKAIATRKYNFSFLNNFMRRDLYLMSKGTSINFRAGLCAAGEHITTVLAVALLKNIIMREADPRVKDFWIWHSMEEVEHSTVAFECLRKLTDGYFLRVGTYLLVSLSVSINLTVRTITILKKDGELLNAKNFTALKRIFSKGSKLLPYLCKSYFMYFLPYYHPKFSQHPELAKEAERYLENESSVCLSKKVV